MFVQKVAYSISKGLFFFLPSVSSHDHSQQTEHVLFLGVRNGKINVLFL